MLELIQYAGVIVIISLLIRILDSDNVVPFIPNPKFPTNTFDPINAIIIDITYITNCTKVCLIVVNVTKFI